MIVKFARSASGQLSGPKKIRTKPGKAKRLASKEGGGRILEIFNRRVKSPDGMCRKHGNRRVFLGSLSIGLFRRYSRCVAILLLIGQSFCLLHLALHFHTISLASGKVLHSHTSAGPLSSNQSPNPHEEEDECHIVAVLHLASLLPYVFSISSLLDCPREQSVWTAALNKYPHTVALYFLAPSHSPPTAV